MQYFCSGAGGGGRGERINDDNKKRRNDHIYIYWGGGHLRTARVIGEHVAVHRDRAHTIVVARYLTAPVYATMTA